MRHLYLAAYDIPDDKRRHCALTAVRAFAAGCQKSFFECLLTGAEAQRLLHNVSGILEGEDRFILIRLDPRQRAISLGIATPPASGTFIVGDR